MAGEDTSHGGKKHVLKISTNSNLVIFEKISC